MIKNHLITAFNSLINLNGHNKDSYIMPVVELRTIFLHYVEKVGRFKLGSAQLDTFKFHVLLVSENIYLAKTTQFPTDIQSKALDFSMR